MTIEQAKQLTHGQIVYDSRFANADGSPVRWRVNGMVRVWKRDPSRVRVPIKHGLYDFGAIDEFNSHIFTITEAEARRA